MHGKHSWKVEGPSNQDAMVAQLLDKEVTEYVRNRRDNQNRGVAFSFWYKPNGQNYKAYAQIRYKVGDNWQTATGDEVEPDDTSKWWHGLVKVELPTDTQEVKVRIVGEPYGGGGFKAWIDLALLSVYYYNTTSKDQGDVSLTTNIYYSKAIPHPELDGFVSLGFGIAAEPKNALFTIAKLKDLKVELLPNNGSATTQEGRLAILYLTQENSRNITKYDLPLGFTTIGFDALGLVSEIVELGASIKLFGLPKFLKTFIAFTFGTFAVSAVDLKANPYSCPIAVGGTSYEVYETLDYSTNIDYNEYGDRISYASAQYYFDWRFQTASDDIFAIKVSGAVVWWEWYDPDPYTPDDEYWRDTGETPISVVISLANYWQ